ncbi:unnamed protein product [Phaeothamnion confervicola]
MEDDRDEMDSAEEFFGFVPAHFTDRLFIAADNFIAAEVNIFHDELQEAATRHGVAADSPARQQMRQHCDALLERCRETFRTNAGIFELYILKHVFPVPPAAAAVATAARARAAEAEAEAEAAELARASGAAGAETAAAVAATATAAAAAAGAAALERMSESAAEAAAAGTKAAPFAGAVRKGAAKAGAPTATGAAAGSADAMDTDSLDGGGGGANGGTRSGTEAESVASDGAMADDDSGDNDDDLSLLLPCTAEDEARIDEELESLRRKLHDTLLENRRLEAFHARKEQERDAANGTAVEVRRVYDSTVGAAGMVPLPQALAAVSGRYAELAQLSGAMEERTARLWQALPPPPEGCGGGSGGGRRGRAGRGGGRGRNGSGRGGRSGSGGGDTIGAAAAAAPETERGAAAEAVPRHTGSAAAQGADAGSATAAAAFVAAAEAAEVESLQEAYAAARRQVGGATTQDLEILNAGLGGDWASETGADDPRRR